MLQVLAQYNEDEKKLQTPCKAGILQVAHVYIQTGEALTTTVIRASTEKETREAFS